MTFYMVKLGFTHKPETHVVTSHYSHVALTTADDGSLDSDITDLKKKITFSSY